MKRILPLLLLLSLKIFSQAPANFSVSGFAGTGACDGTISFSTCGGYTHNCTGPGGYFSTLVNQTNMCSGTWSFTFSSMATGDTYFFEFLYSPTGVTILNSSFNANLLSAFATVSSSTMSFPNCNGQIALNIQGGTPPYTIAWRDSLNQPITGATNDTLSGVCSGNYTFNVTDNTPCVGGTPYAALRLPRLNCNIIASDAMCAGSCNGSAQLQVLNSGQDILSQSITSSSGTNGSILQNQCAGPISGVVADSTGATTTCSAFISQPAILQYQQDSATFAGDLYFTVFGGTPPYTSMIDSLDTFAFYSGQIHYDSLVVGPHILNVTDSAGCHFNQVVMIPSNACTVHITMSNTDCYYATHNSVTATVSGQAPFQYAWSNGDNSSIADSIPFGDTVTVTVTDSYGCVATDLRVFPNFNAPLQCYTQVITNASCSGWPVCCDGSVVLNFQDSLLLCSIDYYIVSGGYMSNCMGSTDYTYYTNTITNLANATYTVTPMSSCGCPYAMTTFNVPGSPVSLMEKPVQTNEIKIAPNPSNGEFALTSNLKPEKAEIYNIEGKKILNVDLHGFSGESAKVSLDIPNGIYTMKFVEKNRVVANERLVIIN